ncbi:MAG: hypothetical protein JO023_07650 [Chloroflexi bacterium]|nr:hypothetical protein [Chloroflexota bacterium]
MNPTPARLIRWSGLAAVVAGVIFAVIQPIHPADVVESATTSAWTIITPLKTAMCMLFLLGITGLYARQVEEAGWLGLAAFLVLSLSWTLQTAFVFAEAFIMPPLVAASPEFVDAFLGISYGHTGGVNLGALPTLYSLVGITYMLGGLLFGVATLRAGILPRVPAALLAVAATLTPLAALLPHAQQRYAAIPVALALAWLGYALLTERPAPASEAPGPLGSQLGPAAAR